MRKSMAAPKHTRPHPEGNETLALFANGSSGKWAVDVDQTTSGTDRWFLQIDGPGVHFYFQIAAPEIVMQLLKFLDGELPLAKTRNRLSEESPVLIIGKERQKPVAVLRDDEYSDRYFFAIGPENSPLVRVTIAGSDLADLRNALRQTKEEMDETD